MYCSIALACIDWYSFYSNYNFHYTFLLSIIYLWFYKVLRKLQLVAMNNLMNILYMVTLGVIRLWRMFMCIVTYIGFKLIKPYICKKLNDAGIGVHGSESHDMIVHDERTFHRLSYEGTLGLGEAYMNGWWDCKKLDEFFTKIFQGGLYQKLSFPWDILFRYLQFEFFNLQTGVRSWQVAETHYDLGKMPNKIIWF